METATTCLVCGSALAGGPVKGEWTYLRCPACGLLTSDPLPSPEQIEAHYAAKFQRGNYELVRRYADRYRRVHEQLADWMALAPGARVLDIGCFTGDLLEILAQRGADVYGLELQTEAVEIANARLPGRVYQADVNGTQFPSGPYDLVTMMGVIEHVLDPRALVARARDLLSPEGRVCLQTPNAGSLPARTMRSGWPPLAPVEHIHVFSARALRELLEAEGFGDVRARRHVKRLPANYVYEQFANFGGRSWQRAMRPLRLLGDTALPFYGGEMLVQARAV